MKLKARVEAIVHMLDPHDSRRQDIRSTAEAVGELEMKTRRLEEERDRWKTAYANAYRKIERLEEELAQATKDICESCGVPSEGCIHS